MPCHVDVADSCYLCSPSPGPSVAGKDKYVGLDRRGKENGGIGRRSKCGLQMQICSPTCSAKQTFLYFTDDYIRSTLGDIVSVPHTSRAKLCIRELNRIRLHTPSLAEPSPLSALLIFHRRSPFARSPVSPSPIPIRIAPAPNPNVILHRILQRGVSEFNCKALSQLLSNPALSWVEVKSRTKDVSLLPRPQLAMRKM